MPPPPLPKGYSIAPPPPPGYAPIDARTPPFVAPQGIGAGGHVPGTPWTKEEERAVSGEPEERSWWDTVKSVGTGVANAAKGVVDMGKRVVEGPQGVDEEILTALAGPLGPLIKDTVLSHIAVAKKAKEELDKGDTLSGTARAALAAIPIVGPIGSGIADKMSETDEQGRPRPGAMAEGIGELAANVAAPEAIRRAATIIPGGLRPSNPVTRAAMEFKDFNGIPSSMRTATGSPFIGYAQAAADLTPLGAMVAEKARQVEVGGFKRVGGELAEKTSPGQPITPEGAGVEIQKALQDKVDRFTSSANQAYGAWRAEMDSPAATRMANWNAATGQMEPIQAPVEIGQIKNQMRSIFEEMEMMPAAQKSASAGYNAIRELIASPNLVPATTAELGLSYFKEMARDGTGRNAGLAKQLVARLQPLVDAAVKDVSPQAFQALKDGRELVTNQKRIESVANKVREEPVQAYGQTIWPKDNGIEHLRRVVDETPDVAPKIGRAWLEDALSKAEYEGGFDKLDGLHAKWRDMGPETKRILFKNPALIKDIGDFFQAAKDSAKDMNPSGSGKLISVGGQLTYIFTEPTTGIPLAIGAGALSKLMHSPAVVKALTQGMKVNARDVGAATSAAMKIRSLTRDVDVPLDKVADKEQQEKQAKGQQP